MNIQFLLKHFGLRKLSRIANDLDSAMESILKYAPLVAVDEYGRQLSYETEINLIGGKVENIFDVVEPVRYEVIIHVFYNDADKELFLSNAKV